MEDGSRVRICRRPVGLSWIALVAAAWAPAAALTLPPAPEDIFEARRFAAARFEGAPAVPPALDAALVVEANHGPVGKDLRGEARLRVAGETFLRGLYCHAASRIAVRLPGPARSFAARAGVDSNAQTRPGRGSVAFAVRIGDRDAFRTGILKEGDPAVPIEADLGGAREFVLEVTDGGDGISCDQAAWGEPRAVLADGSTVRLNELPLIQTHLPEEPADLPLSFRIGGVPSRDLLAKWPAHRSQRLRDDGRREHEILWTDPGTGLAVRLAGVEDTLWPTVEWTLHFRNGGASDSPIIDEVLPLDLRIDRSDEAEFVLHHNRGDVCSPASFEPFATTLGPGAENRFAPDGGRPSNGAWPYFNLHWGCGGRIVAIGWPGQWAAAFARDAGSVLSISAGQELASFRLHPGEEVRTPLILLFSYRGGWLRGQNLWRRWMLERTFPRDGDGPPRPAVAACSAWHFPGFMCNGAGEIEFIDRYLEEGIRLDWWWMDAGWYTCDGPGWVKVGDWAVDRKRYPGGIRAVTDHAHAKGLRCVLWFEPERVHPGTWLAEERPGWIRGGKAGGLVDLGDAGARSWVLDRVDRILTDEGIDLYRQDFNIDPLSYWRAADGPDRRGIAEIRHVEGYLGWWDELRRRHPGMLIDSCASGGRRNDLETMRRAVPLLRTDDEFDSTGNQCHTYGFDLWLPYHECGNRDIDPYAFRSNLAPMMGLVWDVRRRDLDFPLARRLLAQWKEVADDFFGDFYPLTPWSAGEDAWMAWQFDRPDLGKGMVQAFRRPECVYEMARFPLRGLDPEARYSVRDLDRPEASEVAGRELMEKGLRVPIEALPGAVVITYTKVR